MTTKKIFEIPCIWKLRTVEKIEADSQEEAEYKAALLSQPETLARCRIEPEIGVVDFMEQERRNPTKKPPDPMEGWKCQQEPGPYEGGIWTRVEHGCQIMVIGDTGPIDVGMGLTTYGWRIARDGEEKGLCSMKPYVHIENARDTALKAAKEWKR